MISPESDEETPPDGGSRQGGFTQAFDHREQRRLFALPNAMRTGLNQRGGTRRSLEDSGYLGGAVDDSNAAGNFYVSGKARQSDASYIPAYIFVVFVTPSSTLLCEPPLEPAHSQGP
jgi:hypothetical protein